MRMCEHNQTRRTSFNFRGLWRVLPVLIVSFGSPANSVFAQSTNQENLSQQIQKLTDAMARTQAQVEESQRQLDEMRKQLSELQRQVAQQSGANVVTQTPSVPASASSSQSEPEAASTAIEDIRQRQAMQESQIATQEQSKVESESKYPVKITGLLLLSGFVNTGAVDMAATPTVALPGSGSTGASVRQTILGIDASGPHLFGARSYADLRIDFDGNPASNNSAAYSGYYNAGATLLRLRTAHAGLLWEHTEAYFALDHPIFSPDMPTSLTAVAIPALAWSGNLWTWNPQVGINQEFGHSDATGVRLQAALIDVGDAPLSPPAPASGASTVTPPSSAEESRWPGVEGRVALRGPIVNSEEDRYHFGIGGYFAPHYSTVLDHGFNSWAGTLDARFLLPARLEFSGNFYRGKALGGLGGGAYKDFAYKANSSSTGYYFRRLDDVGGWAQLKERFSERLELNAAFGIDNAFAAELRQYAVLNNTFYQNLSRNRTYTGNAIYSPSAYLQFSLEYRRLESSPVDSTPAGSNIIGLGAGYKF